MSESANLCVVIPTHNRVDKLALTLDHFAKQTDESVWEVLVVANNCADGTSGYVRDRASSFPVPLRLVEEATPGAAAARNAGARAAGSPDLLFVDDDILVRPDCIARVRAGRAAHPGAWLLGQGFPLPEHLGTPFGAFRNSMLPPVPESGSIAAVSWFASGLVLVPRDALLRLGGYEERFTAAALEDADLAIRAARAGERVLFDPGLTFLHNDWAGMTIRDYCERARRYCQTAPLLAQRHGDTDHPWAEMITANRPADWRRDPVPVIATKVAKQALGRRVPLEALLRSAALLERARPSPALLWPIYRAAIAASMFSGYNEGLRMPVASAG
jgi:GT2 family glycosyltransferase